MNVAPVFNVAAALNVNSSNAVQILLLIGGLIVGSQFAKARHLDGQESPVAGGVVSVGSKPVLLEGEVHPK